MTYAVVFEKRGNSTLRFATDSESEARKELENIAKLSNCADFAELPWPRFTTHFKRDFPMGHMYIPRISMVRVDVELSAPRETILSAALARMEQMEREFTAERLERTFGVIGATL